MKTFHRTAAAFNLASFACLSFLFARLRRQLGMFALATLIAPSGIVAQVADTATARLQVDSLVANSRKLSSEQSHKEALRVIETAEQAALSAFGPQSAPYAKCLHNHGRILHNMRRPEEAEPFYLQAKAIWKQLPSVDLIYESNLNNLGVLYTEWQRYDEAEENLLEVAAIRKSSKHPDYSRSLLGIGNLYQASGRYEDAERYYMEALAIRADNPGKQSFDYANALNGLAATLHRAGRYENAEPVYQEALAIFKNGKHPQYIAFLGNLAQLYADMGRYDLAEPIMLEVIATIDEAHPEYGNNANNLARLYYYLGRHAEAEIFFHKSKANREKRLTKEHADYAQSLDNLAALYKATDRYAEAEAFFKEALAIREVKLGKNHPEYATNLSNLGVLYYSRRRYAEAELLCLESQTIKENTLGAKHPGVANGLRNLALLYHAWGKTNLATKYFLAANAAHRALIEDIARTASENGILAYLTLYERFFQEFQSFAEAHPATPELTGAVCDNMLFFKGFLFENTRRLARAVAEADTPVRATYERWQACQRQLSVEYAKPITERRRVKEIEAQAEGFEKTLTRSLTAFAQAHRIPRWQDVRDQLQPGEAAIEFLHYRHYLPDPADTTHYAALLLLPGDAAPRFVPLCKEEQIQALTDQVTGDYQADKLQQLYAARRTDGNPALYDLIWAPVEQVLAGKDIKTIYYSPSGILHRLNPAALSWKKSDAPLADRYHLVLLGSTRELTTNYTPEKRKPISGVVYGGIRYEMDSTAIKHANRDIAATAQDTTGSLFRLATPGVTLDKNWGLLATTADLARFLHTLLQQQSIPSMLRLGYLATEESFKHLGKKEPSPSLLHIGTHGFFFPDLTSNGQKSIGHLDDEPVFQISEHPLIRSGLKLAGSRYAWETKHPLPGMEDGILTAHEISQMNLSNTDLVVLSACETGLGDIRNNEGVYGLQRAFRIAGAKNELMSLWSVSEQATYPLLKRFYENWLQKDMTARAALEEAQEWMRRQEIYRNPYYWAGFVLLGK